ncbi:GNAT family N-acetyltransferase [Longispora sp. K20-0274]|uniref:GNAT family N-acetyltransferase n=1 Tax=Longispora sp. K20-0274 TaxID=3088255 RepID=UPI00399A2300
MEIRTDSFVLRAWRDTDAHQVFLACQDPEIQRWTRVPVPYLREHAVGFVTGVSSGSFGIFGHDGELYGSIGVVGQDIEARSAEIGYWVAPAARGRGVATAALRLVCRWAVDTLGVQRLEWRARAGNLPSRLVAERAGFTIEGVQRAAMVDRAGEPADCVVGGLLPADLRRMEAHGFPVVDGRRTRVFGAPQPVLAEAPVTLRAPDLGDVEGLLAACADPEVVRWTSVPLNYTRRTAEGFVASAARLWERGDAAIFAVCGPDGAWAGNMDLRVSATDPAVGDVGFLTAPWARGRGHCTAALRAVTRWAFDELGLTRIEWRAFVGNDGSRRVAEKAGFVIEGVERGRLTHRGRRVDTWLGAKLATDPR